MAEEIGVPRRPRLLVVGDAGQATGFEKVLNGICSYLHAAGTFDLVVRGIGYTEEGTYRQYPFLVKPAGETLEDQVGVTQFPRWLEEDEPDGVLIIHDLWNQCHFLTHKPPQMPSVGYFPVDTPNMKWSYAVAVGAHSAAVTYTQFGARETAAGVRDALDLIYAHQPHDTAYRWAQVPDGLSINFRLDRLARLQNVENWTVIPHGIDRIFEPKSRGWCRRQFGLPEDAFIVLNVNANQFRKRQDITIRAFKYLLDREPNALLVFHCAGGDKAGWDLRQLGQYYGVGHRMLCVHHHKQVLSEEELCWLYNAADVHINTGGGEGWGLSSIDAGQCGIPQLVPDWSATREIWRDAGVLLPIKDWRHEAKFLNTAHAIVDAELAGEALYALALSPEVRQRLGADALARTLALPDWAEVGQAFERVLVEAFAEGPAVPTTYAEMLAMRTGDVRSELHGKVAL